MKKLCFLLAAVMIFSTGCFAKKETIKETVKLYYATKGNAALETESREIQYTDENSRYTNTLKALIQGPQDKNSHETNINPDAGVLDIKVDKDSMTVNLSKEFNRFSGTLNEAVSVASIVDTMLQFQGIKKVRILVEGQELIAPSGMPYGFMEFIEYNTATDTVQKEITLYFADSQAMYVVPEKRTITVKKDITDEEFYKLVLEELIKGPVNPDLYKTIPPEVKVDYVEVDGDLLKVDFSVEMHTKHWGGAAGEDMTVTSIANTMTEFPGIKRVLPSVDGGPMSIEHMVIEEPLTRMEDRIFKQ